MQIIRRRLGPLLRSFCQRSHLKVIKFSSFYIIFKVDRLVTRRSDLGERHDLWRVITDG